MPAYIIAQVKVHNPEEFQKYVEESTPVFQIYGASVMAAAGEVDILEGNWPEGRTIIVKFPSVEQARKWHDSAEYQKVAPYRHRSASTNMVVVDGLGE